MLHAEVDAVEVPRVQIQVDEMPGRAGGVPGAVGQSIELPEAGLNGVGPGDPLKGELSHSAHAHAVHQHISDFVTLVGSDDEGLVAAAADANLAAEVDPAALGGRGGNGVIGVQRGGGGDVQDLLRRSGAEYLVALPA